MPGATTGRPKGSEADSPMAGSPRRGDRRPRGNDPNSPRAGDAARGSDFPIAGEPLPALVREVVPPERRPRDVGQGPVGAIRRRLRGAGPLSNPTVERLDRGDARRPIRADDQPREDPDGETDGTG